MGSPQHISRDGASHTTWTELRRDPALLSEGHLSAFLSRGSPHSVQGTHGAGDAEHPHSRTEVLGPEGELPAGGGGGGGGPGRSGAPSADSCCSLQPPAVPDPAWLLRLSQGYCPPQAVGTARSGSLSPRCWQVQGLSPSGLCPTPGVCRCCRAAITPVTTTAPCAELVGAPRVKLEGGRADKIRYHSR